MSEEIIEHNSTKPQKDPFASSTKKRKILVLSDIPLANSGVGIQAKILIENLIKTGKYTFRSVGGARAHSSYQPIRVNDDFIILPVNGFGTPEMLRNLLITERPDALLLFTDPRQFIWVWQMADEIKQICPIAYWHVWDNDPYPEYNNPWYDSTDLIACISKKTYELVKPNFPNKTIYIPHAFPKDMYYPMSKEDIEANKVKNFGHRKDWFKVLWVNRNADRKCPNDLLVSFSGFLDLLEKEKGHREAVLIMHTDPQDQNGPDLRAVVNRLGIVENVWFSVEQLDHSNLNILHNITDCCINVARAEGHGLSTHIALQVGNPVIVTMTGGLQSQVIDKNGFHLGVPLYPSKRFLNGSQTTPYIFDDYVSNDDTVNALMKIYNLSKEERDEIKEKAIAHIDEEYNCERVVQAWDEALELCIDAYKEGKMPLWDCIEIPFLGEPNRDSLAANREENKILKSKKGREVKVIKADI